MEFSHFCAVKFEIGSQELGITYKNENTNRLGNVNWSGNIGFSTPPYPPPPPFFGTFIYKKEYKRVKVNPEWRVPLKIALMNKPFPSSLACSSVSNRSSLSAKPSIWKWLWFAWTWTSRPSLCPYEWFRTWTRFETEAQVQRNLEMAYWLFEYGTRYPLVLIGKFQNDHVETRRGNRLLMIMDGFDKPRKARAYFWWKKQPIEVVNLWLIYKGHL